MLLCCVSAVSAEEIVSDDDVILTSDVDNVVVDAADTEIVSDESDSGTDECVIYVGQNTTTGGGNGSYENPFATLDLANSYANNLSKNKTTVNIFEGTYYLDSNLNFNTSDLIINGLGEVIIKKHNIESTTGAFSLASGSSNITMSNLIFDLEGFGQVYSNYFYTFSGDAYWSKYINCSFLNLYKFQNFVGVGKNSLFYACYFDEGGANSYDWVILRYYNTLSYRLLPNTEHIFQYCRFNIPSAFSLGNYRDTTKVTMENAWFGDSKIASNIITPPRQAVTNSRGAYVSKWVIPLNQYAEFSANENYLGNNTYEIVGKLTWNGTVSQEGMENFQPMTVNFESATGNISETAILKNGTFRAIYTGNSAINHVSVTLDSQEIELEFANIDMFLDAPAINVGDDQNITITLPQNMTTTVVLVINNKNYTVEFNNTNIVTFTIPDILGEGNYTVNATIDKDGIHAQNSTVLEVSKVTDYEFEVITPSDVVYSDIPLLEIELPEDATGNVTVVVNNKTYTATANKTVSIPIDNLVLGDNEVTTVYGDFKYADQVKNDVITVEKATAVITADNIILTNENCKVYTASLKDSKNNILSNQILLISINNNIQETITDSNGTAVLDLDLGPGIYNVNIVFDNPNYNIATKNTTITVVYDTVIKIISINYNFVMSASLKDSKGNPLVNFTVYYALNDGEKINTTTDEDGLFTVFANDNCLVNITFEGIDGYAPTNNDILLNNIKPVRKATDIEVDPEFTRYANDFNAGERGAMFYFVLKDGDGNILTNKTAKIGINGVIYSVVTDSEGKAGLQINLAKSTAYTYAIAYLGDDEYNASFAVSKLNLVKKPITITPKKTSYTFTASAKNKYVEATLSTIKNKYDGKMYLSQGKKVTLTINGKTYTATAGKNGAIKFNIGSTTKKGTYKVTIKYAGDATYEAGTSKTITIKLS